MAILLALLTRNVLLSLFSGIVLGLFILHDYSFFVSIEAIYELFSALLSELWILKTLAFAILVGSVMALIEVSGGIYGFVNFVQKKHQLINSEKSALMLSFVVGIVIFIESSITALIAGAVGKPLCDKYKIPHAKLAYVCDSTSAPISSLLAFNGWGALLLGLIVTQISTGIIDGNAIDILVHSILYNFYALSAIVVTFFSIYFSIDIGAMRDVQYKESSFKVSDVKSASMYYMILPILLMVVLVFVFLYITGDGNILKGSGSSSIFYTMLTTLLFMLFYYVGSKNISLGMWLKTAYSGARKLFPIAMILLFAFAIGKVTTDMKTGLYLASLASESLNPIYLSAIVFLLSSLIAFSTGTSWGTFSIMIPIAVPMAVGVEIDVSLAIGAVISGGVFGDHCSPISDTTIISSLASDCEVVEHVKTQLPYALVSGAIALVLFFLFSLFNFS